MSVKKKLTELLGLNEVIIQAYSISSDVGASGMADVAGAALGLNDTTLTSFLRQTSLEGRYPLRRGEFFAVRQPARGLDKESETGYRRYQRVQLDDRQARRWNGCLTDGST